MCTLGMYGDPHTFRNVSEFDGTCLFDLDLRESCQ